MKEIEQLHKKQARFFITNLPEFQRLQGPATIAVLGCAKHDNTVLTGIRVNRANVVVRIAVVVVVVVVVVASKRPVGRGRETPIRALDACLGHAGERRERDLGRLDCSAYYGHEEACGWALVVPTLP